ncbi:MAG TPA: hypothetical protein DDZ76_10125 [Xanthomonadales bacterium]|nr:hypothetical protein [Xanthomonadales bacterium]
MHTATGIRTLLAVTTLALGWVAVDRMASDSTATDGHDGGWQMVAASSTTGTDPTEPVAPSTLQRASITLCVAYVGATRPDHRDDRRLRRECADRVGVDLAAVEP